MPSPSICTCPEIQDQDWHLKDQDWSGKFFYFEYLPHFFNHPLGFDKKVKEMKAAIHRKGYQMLSPELVLHLPGCFQGKILTEIKDPEQLDANVEKFENARMLSRVYAGPRSRIADGIEELKAFTEDRTHIVPLVIYRWSITCDKCASRRGGDKFILMARV